MRIALDGSRLAVGQRTGTESYTAELVRALAQLDRRNEYTLYVNQRPAALPALGPNWRIRSLPARRLWTHARLGPALRLDRPAVAFIPAHVLPLLPPPRSVVTIHDLGYEYIPEAHPFASRLYLRLSTRWSARAASHLIAISEATKRDLLRWTGVQAAKITVVYHGVHPRFQPVEPALSAAAAARYGLDGPYLLFLSTIQPRKNLIGLIDAYAQARTANPDLPTLALGGKPGWLTAAIERRAAERGISQHVRFLGYVADDAVVPLLSGATIYMLPSLYEGFGMTILEAMAAGAPVITSAVSSLPEVAGAAAVLIDPCDTAALAAAISDLWRDPARRQALRAAGLAWAAHWTWERCARQTLAVLEATASGHPLKELPCASNH